MASFDDHHQVGCFTGMFRRNACKPACEQQGAHARARSGSVLSSSSSVTACSEHRCPAVPQAKRRSRFSSSGRIATDVRTEGFEKEKHECGNFGPCCNFAYSPSSEWWTSGDDGLPSYAPPIPIADPSRRSELFGIIDKTLDALSPKLRELSLQIHDHPELMFKEKFAHDLLTKFMTEQGFKVTKHYLGLETAWRAEFSHGHGGRVLGINSEMDALLGLGHACGHNLIAISGVGVAIAVKAALEAHNIAGKVVLLGTPAEEGGGGKIILIERGGYKDMDACIMCHPAAGPQRSTGTGSTNALQSIEVDFLGKSAHAGAAPWEGVNALDAAFVAYSGISALRQQMKPDCRIHGVVQGKDWSPNVIPDYAKMKWLVRAPTVAELDNLVQRVKGCFEAASLATGCSVNLKFDSAYYELRQNEALAREFSHVVAERYGMDATETGSSASTDFGNVSFELPSLHPLYAIPTEPNGGNHTPGFTRAAAAQEAHEVTIMVTKGLAHTGLRVLRDAAFFEEVKTAFYGERK